MSNGKYSKLKTAKKFLKDNKKKFSDKDLSKAEEDLKRKMNDYNETKKNKLRSPKTVIKNTTEKIDTRQIKKLISGKEHVKKIEGKLKVLKKIGKKGLKGLPIVGGLVTALASKDATAAVPFLGEAGKTGPEKGSLDAKLESGTITPEERKKLLKKYRGK